MEKITKDGYTAGQKTKRTIFMVCCVAAVAMAAAVIAFTAYVLVLRTNYKKTALEINEAFRTVPAARITVSRGETELTATPAVTEFFNQFFLFNKTVVFNRKYTEPGEKSITFTFPDRTLSLTGMEDGSAIGIIWKTPEKETYYTVRSEITFHQMNAYYQNFEKKALKEN